MAAQGDELADERWFAEQRDSIEDSRRRADEALALFRRAVEALPRLHALLRDRETEAEGLKAGLEATAGRAVAAMEQAGAAWHAALTERQSESLEHARQAMERLDEQLRARAAEVAAMKDGMATASQRAVADVGQEGAAQLLLLSVRQAELLEEARRAVHDAAPGLAETVKRLGESLGAAVEALKADRLALNGLNRRLAAQGQQVEELARRLEASEAAVRALKQDDATIRGTISDLHGKASSQSRFMGWFTASSWWGRMFGQPPAPDR